MESIKNILALPRWLPLAALVIAFAVTAAIGPRIITWLRKMKFGQKILEIGPKWHMNKQNIPTMGGFMFITGITISVLACGILLLAWFPQVANTVVDILREGPQAGAGIVDNGDFLKLFDIKNQILQYILVPLLALAYGAVGFVDDHAKIKKKQNAGLTPLQKLILQIAVAAVFITLLRITGGVDTAIWVPFANVSLEIPWILYIVFAAFIIVGADNAVNLTDGIDGLAAGVTLPVALFFMAVGIRLQNPGVTVFAAALAGGLAAFLIFNFHPAKVFMGDTGSLFLGGSVAGLAFACDMPLILIPTGIIYIWETLSVIIQVTYFKISHGKRVFKMAPFHHHLEMCGWGEKKIVLVFALVTAVMCLLAWFGVQPRLG